MRELVLHCQEAQAEALSDALLEAGVLSVSVEDADLGTDDERPLFGEPGTEPDVQAWERNRVVALLPDGADPAQIMEEAAAAGELDPALFAGWSLRDVPDANVSWTDSNMVKHKHADVGVAVSIPGGLITPIIRSAELKTLSAISNEMKDYGKRAKERKLKPEEYQGGTTAVSNMGMMGVKNFAAVINPPHATILAIGAGEERVVVNDLAGTTRDPVDEQVEIAGRVWTFVDTAGIRRRVHMAQGADFYASLRTSAALEKAEVAVVVLDVSETISEQ
ncbi:MAG: hypothetical protein E2602_08815, partial [Achromobacter sp.]|nr:hypothetical protein [Achromobacter sp.]